MTNIEELKKDVKQHFINEIGETAYYELIAAKLRALVPLKQSLDERFFNISDEERKSRFKDAVREVLVFEAFKKKKYRLLYLGFYEIVLDVFEF